MNAEVRDGELKMGYQPALDGLRALSVIAVILYHADVSWLPGGFLGVEVFFVVSGFLITSLMLEERAAKGRVNLRTFWIRRARRLLPALFVVLVATAIAVATFATDSAPDFRRDVVPALSYVSNWWQIWFVETPYFAASDLPVLRHLWSLAVEEQWYLVWPLVFVVLVKFPRHLAATITALFGAGAVVATALLWLPDSESRTNFLYLSTPTRASGLLLGAALALGWRRDGSVRRWLTVTLDVAALVCFLALGSAATTVHVNDESLYRGWLAATSVISVILIVVAVRPSRSVVRTVLGSLPFASIGRRSYGLYLWHWPIFVVGDAREDTTNLVVCSVVTVMINEVCFRLIEQPARKGVIGRWWQSRQDWSTVRKAGQLVVGMAVIAGVTVVGVRVNTIEARDLSVDTSNEEVVFELTSPSTTKPATTETTVATTRTTLPKLPRRVVIVGDSQAHSLYVNRPSGIEKTFQLANGALDGCGVFERGVGIGGKTGGFRRDFGNCEGFDKKWAASATKAKAEVALVVLGAWEVLDLRIGNVVYNLGTDSTDALFTRQLSRGVQALRKTGASVALLEVPCMRPIESSGGPVPPLPQRRDDARTGHLNELLREFAAPENDGVYFVEGPKEWCTNMKISTSASYRWDGVHVYKPGAKLIFESVASALLQIPVNK
jgi:peptidoglycan/LPS O-acetylase OafA/YrhL/lysophospholipase L1-like esterase